MTDAAALVLPAFETTDDVRLRFLALLATTGKPVAAARAVGVHPSTPYNKWRDADDAFARDWELAVHTYKAEYDERVLAELDFHIFKAKDFKAVKFYLETQLRNAYGRDALPDSGPLIINSAVPKPAKLDELPVLEADYTLKEEPA